MLHIKTHFEHNNMDRLSFLSFNMKNGVMKTTKKKAGVVTLRRRQE